MRVVVHHPARTEEDGTAVEESVAAYRLGRIDDFVNPITGETTSKVDVAAALVEQAKADHPGLEVSIEHLHDNGDDTSTWKDQPPVVAASPGEEHAQELQVDQAAAATGEESP